MTDNPLSANDDQAHRPPVVTGAFPWAETTAAVIYVGTAMATGVLGNAAYDGLRAALGRLRRSQVSTAPKSPDPDIELVARTALKLRCEELGAEDLTGSAVDAMVWAAHPGWVVSFSVRNPGSIRSVSVSLSVDEQRADVRAEIRIPDELLAQRRDEQEDE
ncbi:hypothetical protein ACLQ25_26995 [Micromonospora sp. DT44]|uniref:hypothetical protein n=1 Tax=Micromonospora sp. DT44 TaxID=3393439 RepID=UPI003CFB7F3F